VTTPALAPTSTSPLDPALHSAAPEARVRPFSGLTLVIVIGVFALVKGRFAFWQSDMPLQIPATILAIVALIAGILLVARLGTRVRHFTIDPWIFAGGTWLAFISDWLTREYSLFQGPSIRGELILGCIVSWWLSRSGKLAHSFRLLLPLAIAGAMIALFTEANGRQIFSDDHATFFYRLSLLKENFPHIPFYNPLWNGGIDSRDFFASGSLNVFLLFSPLIALFELEQVYTLIVATLLFGITPLSWYLAARMEGVSKAGAAVAGCLSLCASLLWMRWGLKYGTIGFLTSLALMPVNLSCVSRILDLSRPLSWRLVAIPVVTISLMLCWSLSGIVFIPAIVLGLISIRTVLSRRPALALVVALTLVNLPWITLFWSVSNVSSFVQAEQKGTHQTAESKLGYQFRHKAASIDPAKSVKLVRSSVLSVNPAVLFLGIPGIFLLRHRSSRVLYLLTGVWLLFLGSVAVPLKPQLELDRMLVVLAMLLCLPAGACMDHLLSTRSMTLRKRLVLAMACAFLFVGPFVTISVLLNRSVEQYSFKDEQVHALENAIVQFGGAGRGLFTGCVVHELSGGHLAPLVLSTGRPLIASSFVHNLWRYTQIVPKDFLSRGEQGIEEYFDLYNVSSVFAHEPPWRQYFNRRPDRYREVARANGFIMYQRTSHTSSWFHQGSGELTHFDDRSVRVKLESPSAVLKFNYFPFLESTGCSITPFSAGESVSLIQLSNCPVGEEIVIRAGSPWRRVYGG
jgi:hypothetical protein